MFDNNPFFLPFVKKEQLTHDCYTFFFQRNGTERPFVPGQYYEMKLPHNNMDERGDSRVFTISSSPTDTEFITITTRIIQSSFKLCLASLKPAEIVQFDGPWDDLNFDEKDTTPHVFLAGGIGVTPYHSIVKYCMEKKIKTPMTLFVSWKNKEEMIFDEIFRNANRHIDNFSYVPALTEEKGLDINNWDGEIGRIDENMIKKYVPSVLDAKYFFSGPPVFVSTLKQMVKGMGVPYDKIITEEFEGY